MQPGSERECSPEWTCLQRLVDETIAGNAGRHPGIIAEDIVERIAAAYTLTPRETHHRELRKNHLERTRRFAHEVYRILAGAPDTEPGREIVARLYKSFHLVPRPLAAPPQADGP